MIKVNLLPVKEKKKRKQILLVLLVSFIALLIFLGLFWIYIGRIQAKSDLVLQINQVTQESQGYSDKINEIKDIQNKEASLEGFRKVIDGITDIQKNVLFAFDKIAINIPDGVWFTKITQGLKPDENKFIIDGYAFSDLSLQNYVSVLEKPGSGFTDTTFDIKSISASVGNNKQIEQFEIVTRVVVP
jgi:Tfp pilus assembly protein PilN